MNLIPEKLERARNVDASANGSFQRWLAQEIEKEDLVNWALRDDEPVVVMQLAPRKMKYRFLRAITP